MREILFRGKRKDNSEWFEGFYGKSGDKSYIIYDNDIAVSYVSMKEVIPETIGQYTGLTDKNGKKIFEGDIIRHFNRYDKPEQYEVYRVEFNIIRCMFVGRLHKTFAAELRQHLEQYYEVIGNVYDNPEPLEGASNE